MNFLKSISLLLVLCIASFGHAQMRKISGIVTNSAMEPLAFVNVIVQQNNSFRAKTDIKGEYELKLYDGSYVLIFSLDGFKTIRMPIIVKGSDIVVNSILENMSQELRPVKIVGKKEDISEKIIRNAIEMKYKYMYSGDYSVDAYIKATEKLSKEKGKKDTSTAEVKAKESSIAEVYLTVHFSPPDKIKEERSGVDIKGSKSSLFYLTHTDGNFNFYKNLIEVNALSESPFLSPISNSGLIAYKFKMLDVYLENGKKFYKIRVQPGMLGNALLEGEMIIQDSTWNIHSLKLSFPKYHMVEYDFFEIQQTYELNDSQYLLTKQEFNYSAKYGKSSSSGRTVVYYSNYRLNEKFKKRFFNNELSSTKDSAYNRDSAFWLNLRKEPFTIEELTFLRKNDSIMALKTQKFWQDSTDGVFNKITFSKVFFKGQGFYNRANESIWHFKPLVFIYTPVYIAGPRFNYWIYHSKEFKNKKSFSLFPSANYGTLNRDLKGSITASILYDPFRRARLTGSAGSDFGIINPYNSWLRQFLRSNFYVHDFVNMFHRIELVNGLYLGTGAEFSNRRSIADYKFDPRGDNIWLDSNSTTDFNFYKALYANLSLQFTPFQKYIREPFQKVVIGSKWPDFVVKYRKGLKIYPSVVDFDYLEFQVNQEMKIGLAGISKYRIITGEFLNTKDLRLVDYQFQRSTGPLFFTNPLYAFQGIDSSFATFKRFYEGHYLHRFNGALINKIPFLKKLNIIEVVGAGALLTTERNLQYVEAFVGFEKIIRLWKERIRIGLFLVTASSNKFTYPTQLKFTVEVYDKVKNTWPY